MTKKEKEYQLHNLENLRRHLGIRKYFIYLIKIRIFKKVLFAPSPNSGTYEDFINHYQNFIRGKKVNKS